MCMYWNCRNGFWKLIQTKKAQLHSLIINYIRLGNRMYTHSLQDTNQVARQLQSSSHLTVDTETAQKNSLCVTSTSNALQQQHKKKSNKPQGERQRNSNNLRNKLRNCNRRLSSIPVGRVRPSGARWRAARNVIAPTDNCWLAAIEHVRVRENREKLEKSLVQRVMCSVRSVEMFWTHWGWAPRIRRDHASATRTPSSEVGIVNKKHNLTDWCPSCDGGFVVVHRVPRCPFPDFLLISPFRTGPLTPQIYRLDLITHNTLTLSLDNNAIQAIRTTHNFRSS